MTSFRKRVQAKREQLLERVKESYESKDDKGGTFGSIFIKSKIPEGIGFWKPGKGDHVIDIIPFLVGPNHPKVIEGRIKENSLEHVLDLWVHRRVGAMKEHVVCPAKNFKLPCPICEWMAEQGRIPEAQWRRHKADRRVAYLVWVHDVKGVEEAKGLQIFEVAHWFMEKPIDELAKKKRGGGYLVFSDWGDEKNPGVHVTFTIAAEGSYTDEEGNKQESVQYSAFQFEPRDKCLPDNILDQSFSLDSVVNIKPTYDEAYKAHYGYLPGEDSTKVEPSAPETSGRSAKYTEPEKEPEKDPVVEKKAEPVVEKKEEPKTKKEEPKASSDNKCPGGGKFGVDIEKLSACGDCEIWDDCSDEADRLAKG
jgi:hypothetical protein